MKISLFSTRMKVKKLIKVEQIESTGSPWRQLIRYRVNIDSFVDLGDVKIIMSIEEDGSCFAGIDHSNSRGIFIDRDLNIALLVSAEMKDFSLEISEDELVNYSEQFNKTIEAFGKRSFGSTKENIEAIRKFASNLR